MDLQQFRCHSKSKDKPKTYQYIHNGLEATSYILSTGKEIKLFTTSLKHYNIEIVSFSDIVFKTHNIKWFCDHLLYCAIMREGLDWYPKCSVCQLKLCKWRFEKAYILITGVEENISTRVSKYLWDWEYVSIWT